MSAPDTDVSRDLPDIELGPLLRDADYEYLAIDKKTGPVFLSDLKDRVIIFEIYSMYCPHCQSGAENVNLLWKKIESDPALNKTVTMIGIGNKNSEFEVDLFRQRFSVPFPLIPDKNRAITKELMREPSGAPYFMVVWGEGSGRSVSLLAQKGEIKEINAFFMELKQMFTG